MTDSFQSQTMVVTGASRGLGKEICLHFARLGMRVAAMARNGDALKQLEEEITAFGGSVMILPLDVTDFDALGQLRI